MDNFNSSLNNHMPDDEPIKIGNDLDEPIPFDVEDAPGGQVSHSPLNLGGPAVPLQKAAPARQPLAKPAGVTHPAQKAGISRAPAQQPVSGDRITGVKTFFAKLHAGSLEFLDGQISDWLRENPDVVIKHTNIATGDVVAKKTEPNIIITLWY